MPLPSIPQENEPKQITFNLEDLRLIEDNAGKIMFDPTGEEFIQKWLHFLEAIEKAEAIIKEKIKDEALKLNPNFTSVIGKDVRVMYRAYGSEFSLEKGLEDQVPAELVNRKVTYSLDTKALKAFVEENGKVPYGVQHKVREKQISIKAKGAKESDEE